MTHTAKFEKGEILYWITPTGATMSNNDYSYCSTAQQEQCTPVYYEPINPPQMKTSDSNTAMSDEQLIVQCETRIRELRDVGSFTIRDLTELLSRFQKAQNKWISCEERLPEKKGMQVSIIVTNNNACIGYIHSRGHWIIQGTDMSYKENELHKVTHWQPLPNLPNATK